ncbi:P0434C04.31 [Oryza sativa (japonica cultivar-group)]|uniref:Uncharacterized protein n=1 Tax=Oryza sativa subsp. japonica TaxID=39947 RepID=Q8L489_ORYSJ|nr:hypothetical protein [Oryza sativa Japonica Group]BAD82144.1 hypothetical protein [Oryza sativa Japonica Group]
MAAAAVVAVAAREGRAVVIVGGIYDFTMKVMRKTTNEEATSFSPGATHSRARQLFFSMCHRSGAEKQQRLSSITQPQTKQPIRTSSTAPSRSAATYPTQNQKLHPFAVHACLLMTKPDDHDARAHDASCVVYLHRVVERCDGGTYASGRTARGCRTAGGVRCRTDAEPLADLSAREPIGRLV